MNDLLLKEVAATEDLIIVLERAAQAWAEQNDRLQKEVVGGGGGGVDLMGLLERKAIAAIKAAHTEKNNWLDQFRLLTSEWNNLQFTFEKCEQGLIVAVKRLQ